MNMLIWIVARKNEESPRASGVISFTRKRVEEGKERKR